MQLEVDHGTDKTLEKVFKEFDSDGSGQLEPIELARQIEPARAWMGQLDGSSQLDADRSSSTRRARSIRSSQLGPVELARSSH